MTDQFILDSALQGCAGEVAGPLLWGGTCGKLLTEDWEHEPDGVLPDGRSYDVKTTKSWYRTLMRAYPGEPIPKKYVWDVYILLREVTPFVEYEYWCWERGEALIRPENIRSCIVIDGQTFPFHAPCYALLDDRCRATLEIY